MEMEWCHEGLGAVKALVLSQSALPINSQAPDVIKLTFGAAISLDVLY